ncbi:MAG TPA: glycosyltransferase [Bacteroidales bacterium]|nr:glycosyltransferase [Bacteroidales bacterium]HSA43407.1 glycosyltransferase [Bacteroidales bacterium]
MKWPRGMFGNLSWNVIGDELFCESMIKGLKLEPGIDEVDLFAPNHLPDSKLDVMIYLNDTVPEPKFANKHIAYIQNVYNENINAILNRFHSCGYDGYVFISRKMLEQHINAGFTGKYIPFGVDTSNFCPRPYCSKYAFDVAYVGNDIKGEERSTKYILPAAEFNFGLYGKWDDIPLSPRFQLRFKLWKNLSAYFNYRRELHNVPTYKRVLNKVSRGRIPQEDIPMLYSNAKININCSIAACYELDIITLRTYEVLACGGFLISDRIPLAEEELSDCIVFTDGGDDLKDKIKYYLKHEDERKFYAMKGLQYVRQHATLKTRMNSLLQYIKELL